MSLCFPLSVAQWLVVIELDNGLVSIHLFFYYADQFFKTGLGFGLEPQHQYRLGIGGTDQCPSIVKVDPYAIDVNDFVLMPEKTLSAHVRFQTSCHRGSRYESPACKLFREGR